RGQRERQVDQAVDPALAGERVTFEDPGEEEPEDGVDAGRRERRAEAQAVGGELARPARRMAELAPRERGAPEHQDGDGGGDDEAHGGAGEAPRQAEPGPHPAPPPPAAARAAHAALPAAVRKRGAARPAGRSTVPARTAPTGRTWTCGGASSSLADQVD